MTPTPPGPQRQDGGGLVLNLDNTMAQVNLNLTPVAGPIESSHIDAGRDRWQTADHGTHLLETDPPRGAGSGSSSAI